MIPRVIHYCWFGGNPLPELAVKCIASWRKFCPDYKIVEWNERNFDVACCDYVREAAEAKKWAFVSDYARLWAVYQEGGVYLDTDVELKKNLDRFLSDRFFFAIQKNETFSGKVSVHVATGLGFGAEAANPVVKSMMDEYDGAHFRNPDGTLDMTPCPARNSHALYAFGYKDENRMQSFEGGVIYPADYFCPEEFSGLASNYSGNTVSVHHYSATWKSPMERDIKRMVKKGFVNMHKIASKIVQIAHGGGYEVTLLKLRGGLQAEVAA